MTKTVLGVCAAAAMALASNIEITGFDYPESVLVDGNRVAVSNVGKQPLPMEKDGDGYISLLNTEIPCWNNYIHLFACFKYTLFHHLCIRINIISNLRNKSSTIY